MLNLLAIVFVILGTIIGAFGSLYLKKGAKHFNFNILEQLRNRNLILGVFLFVLSAFFYIYALTIERLSLLYPITSFTYIWVALISFKFLGEKMNKYKWLGVFLIVLGIFVVGYFSA